MSAPLVMIHGFAGSPASWDEVVALLPAAGTVIRPVLLGHDPAMTPPPPSVRPASPSAQADRDPAVAGVDRGVPPEGDRDSFVTEVDRLAALVTERASSGVHLVGYSLGARLALGMLVRHPVLACSATLIGVNPGLADDSQRLARRDSDEGWARQLEDEGLEGFLAAWQTQPLFAGQRRLSAAAQGRQDAIRARLDPRGLAVAMRRLSLGAMPDWWPELSGITVPVTLVAGAADEKFLAMAARAAAELPHGRFHVVAGAGHNVVLERPLAIAKMLRATVEDGGAQ